MFGLLLIAVAAVRSVVAYAVVSIYIVATAPPGILIALLIRRANLLYWLGRQGVRLGLATVGMRYRVTGERHIQRDRPTVYCVNHASNLEPPVLYMVLAAVHPQAPDPLQGGDPPSPAAVDGLRHRRVRADSAPEP